MGNWNMTIDFTLKSKELAELIKHSISRRKKWGCSIKVEDDTVSGEVISDENDDFENWEPNEKVPGKDNVVKWLVDVMSNGALIKKDAQKTIITKLDEFNNSVEQYEIKHHNYSPQSDNYVAVQKFDGKKCFVQEMNEFSWESMWNKQNLVDALFLMAFYPS